jgi:putative transposase
LCLIARVKTTEALKSVFAKKDKGKMVAQPRSKLCPIRYDQRSYWVDWNTNTASLATTNGRQKLNFVIPHYTTHYTGYPVDSADLLYRKGSCTVQSPRDMAQV